MKKTTIKIVALSLFGLLSNTVIGQDLQQRSVQKGDNTQIKQKLTPSGHIRCYTNEAEAALKAEHPERATTAEFEAWLAPKIAQIKADRALGKNIQAVYNIPVVIHIMHDGDAVGTGENITNAQARSQINVMNQDYRRMAGTPGGANTTGVAQDIEINFVIASVDPSGNPTTGVDRRQMTPPGGTGSWNTRANIETMKNATKWDTTKYLNMWTIRFGGAMAGILGYAQFPSNSGLGGLNANEGSAGTDGVVASYDAFGTVAEDDGTFMMNDTYNLGRTMTHEVGHWLGLRHIWGDGTGDEATNTPDCAATDYCNDTPQAGWEHYTCAVGSNTCPASPGNDMVQNYMDYTNDGCMDTFTADQKARMQTVMTVATRRGVLNASTTGTPAAPYVLFDYTSAGNITEGTNCSYTDVDVTLTIIKAPSVNTTATLNFAGGTATNNVDYQILTPSVVFEAGQKSYKKMTIRVFHDGFIEADETVTLNLSLSGGGDAVLYGANNSFTFTIKNNDVAPSTTMLSPTPDFIETFDPTTNNPATSYDLDGDTKGWGTFASSATTIARGFTGNVAGSRSWDASGALTPDNLRRFNSPVALAAGNNFLSFRVGAIDANFYAEHYAVYVTTSNVAGTIITQTPVHEETLTAAASKVVTVNISAFSGQSVYISFRHYNVTDMNILLLDDIKVSKEVPAVPQTAVNTGTAFQVSIPGAGATNASDITSSKMMATLTSDAFDYGCTTVAVSRDQATAGAAAVAYNGNNVPANFVMAKSFTITPAINNATGTTSIKFYFTEAEIAAWESATGKTRADLRIIKDGVAATITPIAGTFATINPTYEGTFNNGLGGVYYFGSDTTLGVSSFELANAISIYPNPAKDILNISVDSTIGLPDTYEIYNNLGQSLNKTTVRNNTDLTVNTSKLSTGLYFIKISKDGNTSTKRFIKN